MQRYRTPTLALAALILFAACATVAPGNDTVLVNAERDLNVAVTSLDGLFKVDAANWQVIDPLVPSWKSTVNSLRTAAPPAIRAANAAVAAYRSALALKRTDPTKITQAQLNALGTDLGQKIVAAVNLGKQAAAIAQQWNGGK